MARCCSVRDRTGLYAVNWKQFPQRIHFTNTEMPSVPPTGFLALGYTSVNETDKTPALTELYTLTCRPRVGRVSGEEDHPSFGLLLTPLQENPPESQKGATVLGTHHPHPNLGRDGFCFVNGTKSTQGCNPTCGPASLSHIPEPGTRSRTVSRPIPGAFP